MWGKRNRRKPRTEPPRESAQAAAWPRILRAALSLVIAAAVVALGLAALDRPIDSVRVTGRFQRVSPLEVQRAVAHSVHGAGLLGVSLTAVASAVERLPWVATATVERTWPHGLAVHLVEQRPAARWSGGGLVNFRGERFSTGARPIPAGLPSLAGPEGTEPAVAERYFAMQSALAARGLTIAALRLDARGSWALGLRDGVTVRLGRERVAQHFATFMAVASKIVARRAGDIAYVDMRYTNGFAIGWRASARQRAAKPKDSKHDA